MICPRTPNSSPSSHRSRAPSPVQFTITSATPVGSPSESMFVGEAGARGEHPLFQPSEIQGHVDDGQAHRVAVGVSGGSSSGGARRNPGTTEAHGGSPRPRERARGRPASRCRSAVGRKPQELPQRHAGPGQHAIGRSRAIGVQIAAATADVVRADVPAPISGPRVRPRRAAAPTTTRDAGADNNDPHGIRVERLPAGGSARARVGLGAESSLAANRSSRNELWR